MHDLQCQDSAFADVVGEPRGRGLGEVDLGGVTENARRAMVGVTSTDDELMLLLRSPMSVLEPSDDIA